MTPTVPIFDPVTVTEFALFVYPRSTHIQECKLVRMRSHLQPTKYMRNLKNRECSADRYLDIPGTHHA